MVGLLATVNVIHIMAFWDFTDESCGYQAVYTPVSLLTPLTQLHDMVAIKSQLPLEDTPYRSTNAADYTFDATVVAYLVYTLVAYNGFPTFIRHGGLHTCTLNR
jgi:hypothetical protein